MKLIWRKLVLLRWLWLMALLWPQVGWSQPKVLVIACEGGSASGAPTSQLMASGLFSSVTAHDCANGVPNLSTYNAVLMYTNHSPTANVFGDALANFVDSGGGVVIATYALSSTWGIGGRIFTAGYSPFASAPSSGMSYSGTLVQVGSHPVFNGVNVAGITYWHNSNYVNPTLTSGSTLLARDANNINMVAVNASGRVIANNIYLNTGYQSSAELYKLIANELAYVATPAKPGGLSGAAWWSRAGSLSLSDNADIITWANDSNSSKNLSGSATRPKFRNNNAQNINFNPVVEFTSATATAVAAQYFTAPSMLGTSTWNQGHYVLLGYPSNSSARNNFIWETAVTPAGYSDGRFSIHFPWQGNLYWDAGNCCSTNRATYTATRLVNSPSVYFAHMDTSSAALPGPAKQGIRQDGVTKATADNPIAFTGNNQTFQVGMFSLETFQGVLAEGMMFLGRSVSATEVAQVESYLGVKYGLTLGDNGSTTYAYLNSAGGTVWSANTGYHNNIVGVGRDDTTKLNQLISRSVNTGDQITIISGAAMPSSASVISPTTGATALATDRSYTIIGDNGQSAIGTASITVGAQAGRTRSSRIWRLQMTGTVPTQLSICIPDSMLPSGFTAGAWATDLWLTTATAADFSTGTAQATMTVATCVASGVGVTTGVPGRIATISNTVLNGMGGVGYFTVTRKLLDHIEVTASSNTGVTCAPTTYTIKACGDAACTSLYTGGLTGTLTLTGTGVTANFPSGAAFTIASGSSTTTVVGQVTTPSTATVGASGLSLTPANATPVWCGLGATANSTNACTMTVAEAGFLLSVPHHRAGYSQTVSLSAVKKADNSLACVAAFTGTQTVNVGCSYLNPNTGTKPLLVGGTAATNTSTNPSGTCNGSTSTRSLVFDANGQTTTTVQYDDVGQLRLNVSASGSGSSAGLSLTGTADFVIAPFKNLVLASLPSGSVAAGSSFGYTVTAVNAAGQATPNFGRESPPETFTVSWIRNQPTGSSSVDGSFTLGSASSAVAGVVSYTGASWSEVGRAGIAARLSSGNYLGSGYSSVTGTGGNWSCAVQGGTCVIPAGATGSVSFDGGGANVFFKHGLSGSIPCTIAYFGDPLPGVGKSCWLVLESGVYSTSAGTLVTKPQRLEVSTANACGSFSYAGQPFGATVTAKNALGAVTQNYDGTANTSPNFAKAVSFSDGTVNANGSLTGSVAASAFNQGIATLSGATVNAPVFSFSNKLTAPQTIGLRATDTDGVSSSGYDGSMTLRSGRLQMSNAFGGDKTSLQIPLQLQYWSGKSWVKNSDDTCTVIPTASVVRAQTLNHNNTAASWSSAISSITLSGGSGNITLGAPSPSGTGTVDLSINLGATTTDVSCLANHPSSTGAGLPWLRSRQGSCASSFDRDPSARGTFGVYSPETLRSVHVREVF